MADTRQRIRKRSIFSVVLIGLGLMTASIVQQNENKLVQKNCRGSIYTIGRISTGIGPVYVCTSTMQAFGPSEPLHD